ncbi:MAG: hypothetical protein MKZ59_08020 [Deinococcales bacterium]|nr:hypothetical protein [Deinococcales bacterium]
MRNVFEDSVDGFIQTWKSFSTRVRLFPKVEGSPLLECQVTNSILHLLDRTGPYASTSGEVEVIINATGVIHAWQSTGAREFEVKTISHLKGTGEVLAISNDIMVIDIGFPLVFGPEKGIPNGVAEGSNVSVETFPPIHGFVVSVVRDSEPIDEDQLV